MKKVVIFAVIVGAILLLLPPVVGSQAQSRIEASAAEWSELSGGYLEIAVEDYDKGWFASTAKLRFRFTDAYIEANPLFQADTPDGRPLADVFAEGLTQDLEIAHGPILLGDNTGFGLGEVVTVWDGGDEPELKRLLEQTGNDYFLRSAVTLGMTGSGDIVVDAPPFTLQAPADDVEQVVFAGAEATGTVDVATSHIVMTGQMNGFSVVSADGEAVVERTRIDFDMQYPETDPYGLGGGEVVIDRIVALSESQTAIDLQQAKFGFNSNKGDDDKVSMDVTYAINAIKGSDVDLKDLNITFGMGQLDAGALREMQALSATATPDPTDPLAAMNIYREPIYDLLAGGMTMHFDPLRFNYDSQAFKAKLNVATKPGNLPEKAAFTLDNPLIFMNLFAITADLSIDKNLAMELAIPQLKEQLAAGVPEGTEVSDVELEDMARAQAPMMLGALVGQGLILEEGANYRVSATYDNGALMVNGTPMPLGALMSGG